MDGKPVEGISPQDNVSISPNGSVKMRMRFTDFTGKFVFHCHVLHHEDHGMMSVIEVVDPENPGETTSVASEPATTRNTSWDCHCLGVAFRSGAGIADFGSSQLLIKHRVRSPRGECRCR